MADEDSPAAPSSQLLEPSPESTRQGRGRQKTLEKKTDESRMKRKRKHSFTNTKHAGVDDYGNSRSNTRTGSAVFDPSSHVEANASIGRALEVQSNLEAAFPSFIKTLLRSHCQNRYRMVLPGYFSKTYLPFNDVTLVLETEDGKCYDTRYFSRDAMLGAGWRQFCHAHQLKEGDVLVFHLVKPTRFKVYIVKIDNLNEVDGALGLLGLDKGFQVDAEYLPEEHMPEEHVPDADEHVLEEHLPEESREPAESGHPYYPPSSYHKRKKKKKKKLLEHSSEQSRDQSEEVVSEVLEGSKSAVREAQFDGIKGLEDFKILVNGEAMDSEFTEDIRRKYYELCLSHRTFIHANLVEGINNNLVISSITETVIISEAIRSCNRANTRITAWDRTLKALEILGMNVTFLHDRVKRLMALCYDSENADQKYMEAEKVRVHIEEKIRKMEARLEEMRMENEKLNADIESLKMNAESLQLEYVEVATAPW